MRLLAYAKLNLSLAVLHRRPDGFHDLRSVVQTIDLADQVEVERHGTGVELQTDTGLGPDEDLAGRAATLLLHEKRVRDGARIAIKKVIPTGAGLGGGSSDAAAVLWALDSLTPPPLPAERLYALAAGLGSDVPLFLRGGRLRIEGRGERWTALPCPGRERFVVLVPPLPLASGEVYARLDLLGGSGRGTNQDPPLGSNDLFEVALDLCPALRPYPEYLRALGATYWGMSGSGGAFFASFRDNEKAARGAETLRRAAVVATVFTCRPTASGHREVA